MNVPRTIDFARRNFLLLATFLVTFRALHLISALFIYWITKATSKSFKKNSVFRFNLNSIKRILYSIYTVLLYAVFIITFCPFHLIISITLRYIGCVFSDCRKVKQLTLCRLFLWNGFASRRPRCCWTRSSRHKNFLDQVTHNSQTRIDDELDESFLISIIIYSIVMHSVGRRKTCFSIWLGIPLMLTISNNEWEIHRVNLIFVCLITDLRFSNEGVVPVA